MKKLSLLICLFVVASVASGHEFWLQPERFFYSPGDQLKVAFRVGENFMGEPWNLARHRIDRLEIHQNNKVKNVLKQVTPGEHGVLEESPLVEGTAMIVMQSNKAFSVLEGEKFNSYLQEDGLDDAYYHREKNNLLEDSAREFYSRYSKLLVQVGERRDDTYAKVVGLPIEIIPLQNPYNLKVGSPISYKILFKDRPLFGAKVRVWNRYNNRTTVQNIYSQQDGTIEARITNPGAWMVSVVVIEPSKDPKADWESYWGSLVFGVK
ncbi:DUF4198 domain-containing protein [Chryseosolibacter indicus]|uniref:DUF4198 domain-containing protein n=1 Tax=Chryseosolibacter indicus TaxID=2782351 RepID=A0ABS5VNX5_9BACT|nr:DUF4198 domain-containing protein [Chryseosolibacter indicus]MBT1703150.1 DUF4198 domain-containing protein [Chryseosolibacter indicus]